MPSNFRPPEALSLEGNVKENWRIWKQKFENFMIASEKDKKDDKVKIAMLLNLIGEESVERFNQFEYTAGEDPEKYDDVVEKLQKYFDGTKRLVFMRYKFWSYKRPEGQGFLEYLTTLQTMAKSCEFTEKDNMIRDKIIFSLDDTELKEKLLEMEELTLAKTRDKCVAAETTRKEVKLMSGATA